MVDEHGIVEAVFKFLEENVHHLHHFADLNHLSQALSSAGIDVSQLSPEHLMDMLQSIDPNQGDGAS